MGQLPHYVRQGIVVFSASWIIGKGFLATLYDVVDFTIRAIEFWESH